MRYRRYRKSTPPKLEYFTPEMYNFYRCNTCFFINVAFIGFRMDYNKYTFLQSSFLTLKQYHCGEVWYLKNYYQRRVIFKAPSVTLTKSKVFFYSLSYENTD